jgi:hypothetical protein
MGLQVEVTPQQQLESIINSPAEAKTPISEAEILEFSVGVNNEVAGLDGDISAEAIGIREEKTKLNEGRIRLEAAQVSGNKLVGALNSQEIAKKEEYDEASKAEDHKDLTNNEVARLNEVSNQIGNLKISVNMIVNDVQTESENIAQFSTAINEEAITVPASILRTYCEQRLGGEIATILRGSESADFKIAAITKLRDEIYNQIQLLEKIAEEQQSVAINFDANCGNQSDAVHSLTNRASETGFALVDHQQSRNFTDVVSAQITLEHSNMQQALISFRDNLEQPVTATKAMLEKMRTRSKQSKQNILTMFGKIIEQI